MKIFSIIKRSASALLAILIVASVISFGVVGCTEKSEAEKMRGLVALKSKNFSIDCSLMAYMFVSSALSMSADIPQSELDEKGFDMELDFNEQIYEGEQTWFDLFMGGAVEEAQKMLVCLEYARAKGIELSDADRAAIDGEITNMRIEIAIVDGQELEDYFRTLYRGYFELSDYRRMLELTRLSGYGYEAIAQDIEASLSDDDIVSFANTLEGFEWDETATRLLCCILTNPDQYSNEDELAPLVNELLEGLIGKSGEEEKLAAYGAFAEKYNYSSTYLYRNVAIGDMIEEIDGWLYATGRKSGDVGIVQTDYGYHILYYVGEDDPVWMSNARQMLLDKRFNEAISSGYSEYGVKVNLDNCDKLDF